jgi:hypothetical protein
MNQTFSTTLFIILIFFGGTMASRGEIVFEVVDRIDVEPVWSGHPVGFALLTAENTQFAAYYDAERNMVIAQRKLDEKRWSFKRLPTKVDWDSHNNVTMNLDQAGCLHVSGNMHNIPLIYFRSEKPLDIESLQQIPAMTGEHEQRCCYPQFITGPNKELFFTYRDGGSGNGSQFWNVYNDTTKTWSRLFDTALFDGQGQMNAYVRQPVRGPDGFYHLTWIWRDTSDCATNHDISYARSRDMRTWENSSGEAYSLPITLENSGIVDPVPSGKGLLNSLQWTGFDLEGRVIVSYTKYDDAGYFQIFNARLESGNWKHYQTSDWDYRWEPSGTGSIGMEVSMGAVTVENGTLVQRYSHAQKGGGRWQLDPVTLKPIGQAPNSVRLPRERIELDFPNIQSRSARDIVDVNRPYESDQVRYMMYWESLPVNRDSPHPVTPPPSMLRVLKLQSKP